ncbi:MAG: PRC-barrel domain-containing protein [Alphaproteobacteria bacterium]
MRKLLIATAMAALMAPSAAMAASPKAMPIDDKANAVEVKPGDAKDVGGKDREKAADWASRWENARVVDAGGAGGLVGSTIVAQDGQEIGTVESLVTDAGGAHFAVIDAGGYLGVGSHQVTVPLERLRVSEESSAMVSSEYAAEIESQPTYDAAKYRPFQGQ